MFGNVAVNVLEIAVRVIGQQHFEAHQSRALDSLSRLIAA
jgi:hypothetical protein